jgi:NAD(P)-dependent dehydrogenase (short-subunit alcohol dehydrogenase family)
LLQAGTASIWHSLKDRSSGLGLATTRLLSEKGANVAVLDLQEPPEGSSSVKFWKCDVSNDARVEACIKDAIEWSEKESLPIAGAICCAGVGMAGRVFPAFIEAHSDYFSKRHTILHGDFQESLRCMSIEKNY